MRAPALPFSTLLEWAEGVEAPGAREGDLDAALERDRKLLRGRLAAQLARPEVKEALFVASPSLSDALGEEPSGKAESAAVRYLERMASRATPFGLFAGCGVGWVGERTELSIPPRESWRRSTRFDADRLDALSRELAASNEFSERITFRPNTSLDRAEDGVRFVEARLGPQERSHRLLEAKASRHLDVALSAAREGATTPAIVDALVKTGLSRHAAEIFLRDLVDAQVLVSDLSVPVTGTPPLDALLDEIEPLGPSQTVATLRRAHDALTALDNGAGEFDPVAYRDAAALLEGLGAPAGIEHAFAVDLSIPLDTATLARATAGEIAHGVELLRRLAPHADGELDAFTRAFVGRYDEREVPLLEALDSERGIGFGAELPDPSPLLDGVVPAGTPAKVPFGRREARLLALLQRAWSTGSQEIALSRADVEALADGEAPPPPAALAAMVTLARTGAGPRIVLQGADGPSGIKLLGRFCHADPRLEAAVRGHLRAEEALEPGAVFAEIVHLPSGRMANILGRPVLRDHEIEWLGRSGAPVDRRLPAADLLVSVRDGRVVLRSRRLGRRVIPRLSSAHNWNYRSPPLYRFLCELQYDGSARRMSWSWVPFIEAPFLPRIRHGRLVLSRARWLLAQPEIRGLVDDPWRGAQALRAARRLPRWVALAEGDNRLTVDLDNVLSVEAFVRAASGRSAVALEELFPAPDELAADGPEGPRTHELVVPFLRVPGPPVGPGRPAPAERPRAARARRLFPPGSEWTYFKLYGGTASLDRLLRDDLGPLARSLVAQGVADRWFFIRYTDPEFHLRVRLHGDPRELRPALEALMAEALERGAIHDACLGTYRRELERYGGPDGLEAAERLFHADSDAVVELLSMFSPGAVGHDERWQMGLVGGERLMRDLGLGHEQRLEQTIRARNALEREHRPSTATRQHLGGRFRARRPELERLLELTPDEEHPLAPGVAVLARRSERIEPIAAELSELRRRGRLDVSRASLSRAFVHMWLNRLHRSENRAHEWVTYDLLARLHRARGSVRSAERPVAVRNP